MRTLLALGLAVAFGAAAAADDKKDPTAGNWTIESVTRDGKPEAGLKGGQRAHIGGKYTMARVTDSAKPFATGTYTLETTKSPIAIDMKPQGGTYDGKTLLGIVKVEGDTMTICFAEPGKDRPTKFESKEGSGLVLAIYKKAK